MAHTTKVRVGVIGAGVMGARHARTYAHLDEAKLVGIFDPDIARASDVVQRNGGKVFHSLEDLFNAVDAVSIVCPTSQHAEVAIAAIDHGLHVLIEKPMTASVHDAQRVIERCAHAPNAVVLVGHIERFNPTIAELRDRLAGQRIRSVTLRRMSPFENRCLDSDVIQDLMIHDIDLALELFSDRVSQIDGVGSCIMSDKLDQVIGQLWMEDGVNVTLLASRVAARKARSIDVRTDNAWIVADLLTRTVSISRLSILDQHGTSWPLQQIEQCGPEFISIPASEPLRIELQHFIDCILGRDKPVVDVIAGFRAIAYATAIAECIHRRRAASDDARSELADIA
jgi:predicted dehydrogenase